jgi:hypothetical protein
MNPEAEQPDQTATEQVKAPAVTAAAVETKRPAGVPVWRIGKPDAFLAGAVDVARSAVEGITPASTIGTHLGAKSEGDRLVTHLFESRLPGYQGWQWFAVLTRNSRSKVVTISELGLLPSEESILAPEWVPWAERVRPEDAQDEEALEGGYKAADAEAAALPDAGEPETEEPESEEYDAGEPDSDEPGTDEPGTEEPDAE